MVAVRLMRELYLFLKAHYNPSPRDNVMVVVRLMRELYLSLKAPYNHSHRDNAMVVRLMRELHLSLKAPYNHSHRDNAMVAVRLMRGMSLSLNHSAAVPLVTNKPTFPPLRQRRI